MAYKLSHPDSKTEIEVRADQVETYTSQGWETKPTAKTPPATDAEPVKKK